MKKPHIAIIAGGPSAEASVSRSSATEVAKALRLNFNQVDLLELDGRLTRNLLDLKPDVVFPVLHGPPGEDGTVQGYLEILGFPYVGSDVHASAAAMDKSLAKALFRAIDLPVCPDLLVSRHADILETKNQILSRLGEQVVLKPLNQGSAIGVIPIMNGGNLEVPLKETLEKFGKVLVEAFVMGREMTVGVLAEHNEDPQVAPVIEIRTPEGSWYDYEHRYDAALSEHLIPARITPETERQLKDIALNAHLGLGCRDFSRADFIVSENQQGDEELVLLEVNTLPGMTPTSLYPDGMSALGIDFPELVARLVDSALNRARSRKS